MRNAFADEITKLAGEDPALVLLAGDIGNRLFDKFKAVAPDRFYNCGVAEANMVGIAAGLGMSGFRPVVYTITPFTTTRVMEQIRVDVCYHDVPVIIVGTGSGLSYASLGPTHHSCEDMAMLRALPGMSVFAPGDPWEVRACLRAALKHRGPVYMRIGKKGEPAVHQCTPEVSVGRSITLREGENVTLLAVGVMVPTALAVADELVAHGVSARVVSVVSVKPLDEKLLGHVFDRSRLVATIEEHSVIGGFGAAVSEWLVDRGMIGVPLVRFGTADAFIHESGDTRYARERMGLDGAHISRTLLERLKEKSQRPDIVASG